MNPIINSIATACVVDPINWVYIFISLHILSRICPFLLPANPNQQKRQPIRMNLKYCCFYRKHFTEATPAMISSPITDRERPILAVVESKIVPIISN